MLVVVQEGTYILIFIFLNNGAGYCAECSAKSECRTECIADTKIQKSTSPEFSWQKARKKRRKMHLIE